MRHSVPEVVFVGMGGIDGSKVSYLLLPAHQLCPSQPLHQSTRVKNQTPWRAHSSDGSTVSRKTFYCAPSCDNNIAKYKSSSKKFRLNMALSLFAGGMITQYTLGICYDYLNMPDFDENFHEAFMAVSEFGDIALQFP